ncbi:hypothetical protein [Methylotenera sp.]|uniref:hypothetical protein n=1 Tax=Methylotenera sp. TaxID=2051956 RepID=UPI002489D583|nr:hypothetical protein [Methylotenera sp.]MDI1362270.1 hypothetical protein [Methylotenera sp.]
MIVTATQIKFNSILSLFYFLPMVKKLIKQLNEADGLIFYKLRGVYTLTGWKDHEAMRQFRNNGAHLDAMKNIKKIGLAKSVTWETKEEPSWDEAKKRLIEVKF